MNDDQRRHPEAMTMGAFVDGTLSREEIADVAAHLRTCGECRTVVTETARFTREEAERREPVWSRTWWLTAAAVLAMIAIAAPLTLWLRRNATPIDRLVAAAPEHRSIPARLAGFPYGRLQAPARGAAALDPADLKLAGAAGDVLDLTRGREDAEALHASGVAYLVIGRRSESITALETAARRSNDARTWNDLAAAQHAYAVEEDRPSELPRALFAADRAIALDPRSTEAHFNRALILESMGLREQARKAWEAYLVLDGGSAWSMEARAHLARLAPPASHFDPRLLDRASPDELARAHPQETRTWTEGPRLAAWADAEAAHDSDRAHAELERANALAGALAAAHGERLLTDAIASIERSRGDDRDALVRAHRMYRDARIDYSKRLFARAEQGFRTAQELFARGGSPMANVAAYYAASTAFDQNRGGEARAALLALLDRIDASRHRALAAQIHWQLAVCANAAGDWGTAMREADAGAAIFTSLGESANAAFLTGIGAMPSALIGDADRAWRKRVQAFSEFSTTGDDARLATILRGSALTMAALDDRDAALSLYSLLGDTAPRDDAARLSWAEADVARVAARNGDRVRAMQSLGNARALSARIADASLRASVAAQIDLADATLNTTADAAGAVARLERSIAFFTAHGQTADAADAFLQRARAHRAAQRRDAALDDYAAALGEIERQRASLRDAESRLQFLDTASAILEETIELRLERGDAAGAFAAADRVRRLFDDDRPAEGSVAVPAHAAIIEYAVLPRFVVAFCVTRAGLTAHRIAVERDDLRARVGAFANSIRSRGDAEAIDREAGALGTLLFEPLRAQLTGVDDLVIVPDRELYALPFAALRDTRSGRYLAERFVIRFAPSAVFQEDAGGELAPALVIADPRTPHGPRLPGSRDEAVRIAALHRATLLAGEAATRAAFAGAASRSALIHYAGHANSDARSSYGALLLSPAGADGGVAGASDVARLRLDRHPLVILAACGTFRGNALHVAGMSSLARAFLLAGARGVVGTLWEIDDDVAASLFLRVHERLRAGLPPSRALREAQLDLLRSGDAHLSHPASWAPVEYLISRFQAEKV